MLTYLHFIKDAAPLYIICDFAHICESAKKTAELQKESSAVLKTII